MYVYSGPNNIFQRHVSVICYVFEIFGSYRSKNFPIVSSRWRKNEWCFIELSYVKGYLEWFPKGLNVIRSNAKLNTATFDMGYKRWQLIHLHVRFYG